MISATRKSKFIVGRRNQLADPPPSTRNNANLLLRRQKVQQLCIDKTRAGGEEANEKVKKQVKADIMTTMYRPARSELTN